jgi:hypothetical protein
MVCAQNLAYENPQRDQRRIDPVQPARTDGFQSVRNDLLREDAAERQLSILKKLTSEESDLLLKPSLVRIPHPCGLLAGDGSVDKNHLRKRGLFAYVILIRGLAEIYVPFVDVTDAS